MSAEHAALLVVDDEPRVLDAVRRCLRPFRGEWEVALATSAKEALAALGSRPIDFLVTDMRMPEVGGIELLEQVRERHPRTVRVVLSGQTDFDAAMRAATLAHQFLGKPCTPQAMLETMVAMRGALAWIEDSSVRDDLVARTTLPSPPEACEALERALAREPSSTEEAAEIVARDTAMSAKVLQVARSSFFGLRATTNDVRLAVSRLGVGVLRALKRDAFRSDAWPSGVELGDPRSLADRVGALLGALVPASRALPRAAVGETVLRLWGVGEAS